MTAESRADESIPGRSHALFGRSAELSRLQSLAAEAGPTEIACVLGAGGLGKTRLIEAFAATLARERHPFAPLIDFYHIDIFRASAIEQHITDALAQAAPGHAALLEPYEQARDQLNRSRANGGEFEAAQRAVRASFISCYNALADAMAGTGRRVVLLFDTVEQAVILSDEADRLFGVAQTDSTIGGEHWLRATLPRLHNTLAVLGGRPATLYGQHVALYDSLGAQLARHDIALSGLSYAATVELAHDMLAQARASQDEQTAGIAAMIDLDDREKLRAWHQLSEGLPFWVAILFTIELLGNEPAGLLSRLQEAIAALAPDAPLPQPLRAQFQAELRDYFLGNVTQDAPQLLIAMQCMATIRKGLTPDLLALALDRLQIVDPLPDLFERLRALAVVKERRVRRYTAPGPTADDAGDRETLLFLHDELYAWLDSHPIVTSESRAVVREAVFAWYLAAIERAEGERYAIAEQLLYLPADDPEAAELVHARYLVQRRRRQLQRDLLGYAYEGGARQRAQAAAMYHLLAYEAIFSRDSGQDTAFHQEALRNLYRGERGLTSADVLGFAALWLLRGAVQSGDRARTQQMLAQLSRFDGYRQQSARADLALFDLATAIAMLYTGTPTDPDQRYMIAGALGSALRAIGEAEQAAGARAPAERQWLRLLRAQALNFHGYLHRLNYDLAVAIQSYRRSVAVADQDMALLPQFRATTLNNLSFALSEQGDTEEAERLAYLALGLRQRYGTASDVAMSRNILARILIRAGKPALALRYAEQAIAVLRAVGSPRMLAQALPTLAEARRKLAEQLDDSPAEQEALFARALEALDEADTIRVSVGGAEADRERLQARGCTYRSMGLVQMRRGPAFHAEAKRNLSRGHNLLEQALDVAIAKGESALIRIDILEDLAAVHVNEDEYDHRVYEHLDAAERLAPPAYKAQEGSGPVEVKDATRAYWRELGQCSLQRMLSAFGKYDFGEYAFEPEAQPQRRQIVPPGNAGYLDEAAQHMVIMMAYLCRYNRQSWMLNKARQLTLRDLLHGRSPDQLNRIQLAAYETAKRHNLLYDESFAVVEQIIRLARENLALEA